MPVARRPVDHIPSSCFQNNRILTILSIINWKLGLKVPSASRQTINPIDEIFKWPGKNLFLTLYNEGKNLLHVFMKAKKRRGIISKEEIHHAFGNRHSNVRIGVLNKARKPFPKLRVR